MLTRFSADKALQWLKKLSGPVKNKQNALSIPLLWDGSRLMSLNEDHNLVAIAQWDGAKRRAVWAGHRLSKPTARLALAEPLSYCGMCAAPEAASEAERAEELCYNLDTPGCAVQIEDALAIAVPVEGNKRPHESQALFAVSKRQIAALSLAADSLGLDVKSAEPWGACLARGAMLRARVEAANDPVGVFVPGERMSWLFVFRAGELQWLWIFSWGREKWAGAAEALLEAVENFNDRVSNRPMSALYIVCAFEEAEAAQSVVAELSSPYLSVSSSLARCDAAELPTLLVLEGLSHADH